MNSNVNMIQGDLRHMDRSTTITNRDAFNIESTVTEQQLPPTASLVVGNDGKVVIKFLKQSRALILKWFHSAPTTLVSPDPSAARHEQDTHRTSGKRTNIVCTF